MGEKNISWPDTYIVVDEKKLEQVSEPLLTLKHSLPFSCYTQAQAIFF